SSDSLFRTIAGLDSVLFDAYNRCDLVRLGSFVAEDLEFYHDQTGLARGRQPFIDAVRQNICGKVRRDPVRSSLEVYPLKGYGAVETGGHMFCDPRVHRVCDEKTSGIAKFVILWQLKDGTWSIPRVISYNHVSKR
ncbi:MAG: nuclear transport factor 2 family protein, partial [Gemmatimonadota bacterium]|nr:nuclear transport factor 2 family protein [Gemmatimonadota bacterium]